MLKKVKVGNRMIGEGEPCFVIAEAGSNHDGSYEQALKLIDVAVSAGADAIKFQTFKADRLYPVSAGSPDYLKLNRSIHEIVKAMEMPVEWIPKLAEYCRQKNILFMSTPFDEQSVDLLNPHVEVHKIASYELTHHPLVRYIAGTGKPIILSTGTANLEEVEETVEQIRKAGHEELILMQCTASYPAPMDSLNLRVIQTFRDHFRLPVGLSDHSRDPLVGPLTAVGAGAQLIEKHFTLSNAFPGPDHAFALEPDELSLMIHKIKEAHQAMGDGRKVLLGPERELHSFARRAIFAVRDIEPGEVLTSRNIAVLRRGNLEPGLDPKCYEEVLGKRALKRVKGETPLRRGDYA